MAISAVAYRSQLQAEKTAGMSRVNTGRGRVLSGFGGDLAGYNQSLMQKRADLEDQLIQKQYDNGEITLDALINHLTASTNRSWVTPEQRSLINEQIQSLQQSKLDEVIANQYKNGQIKAGQVAAYDRSKLAKLNPGSPVYQNLQAEIAGWDQKTHEEALATKEQQALTNAASMGDSAAAQLALEKSYSELSDMATQFNMPQESLQYKQKSYNAANQATSYKEQQSTATAKVDRQSIIDQLNLAINDYHDNKLGATDFLATLDQLQSLAINKGQSDLLDSMNKWVDATREDMAYGKAWDRGGTRTGGIKSGSGVSGTGVGGGSWDAQDKLYKDNVKELQNELTSGKITADQYKSDLADTLKIRASDLQERVDYLGQFGDTQRISYQGSKQQVGNVMDKISNEMNNNWGAPLGLSESEAGKVGLQAMSEDFSSNQAAFVPVMSVVGTGPGARPAISFQLLTPELKSSMVADTSGVYHLIKSETGTKQILDQNQYDALPDNQKMNYSYDASTGNWGESKTPSKRYVDIYGQDGSQIRYYVDNQNKIINWEANITDKNGLPQGMNSYKDYMQTPTNFDTPNYVIQRAKAQRDAEMASLQNPATQLAPGITTPIETPKIVAQNAASDALAKKMNVLSPTVLPPNLDIQAPMKELAQTTPSVLSVPAVQQPVQRVQQPLRDVSQPTQINKNLVNAGIKVNLGTPPALAQVNQAMNQADTATSNYFQSQQQKQNSWLYNPISKLRNLFGIK